MQSRIIVLHLYIISVLWMTCTISVKVPEERLNFGKFKTSAQRIRDHEYPAETHQIEDSDGYILTLFRIPYSHNLSNENKYRPAILLQHGLFSNSDCWLTSGPYDSLAFMLADVGFDVWLGNARGNIYSRNNTKISLKHPHFWRFSWHEIGISSIATMIDYIRDQTGQDEIHYAGHSQGTTVYLVLLSERPEYNAKIKSAHLLAPCAFSGHGTSFVFNASAPLVGSPDSIWNKLLMDMELIPQNRIINRLVDNTCSARPPTLLNPLCKNIYLWFTGDGYKNTNISSLQMLIETHPAGSASNQGIHYIQLHTSHEFRQFDWGLKKNRLIYNQDTPPNYNLDLITAPTHLYSSQNDALCAPEDVNILVSKFTHLKEDYRIPDSTFNHLDFIVANNMKELLNDVIVENLRNYET